MNRREQVWPRSRHGARGFTLIELMIVVAIIAVLAKMAIPNLIGMRDNIRTTTSMGNLQALVSVGRTEAMRSGNRYVVAIQTGPSPPLVALFGLSSASATITVSSLSTAQMQGTAAPLAGMYFVQANDFQLSIGIGPPSGYPGTFTAPMNVVTPSTPCSFCSSGYGAIYLETDGTMTFSNGTTTALNPLPWAGVLVLSPTADWAINRKDRIYALTMVAGTGAVHVWHY